MKTIRIKIPITKINNHVLEMLLNKHHPRFDRSDIIQTILDNFEINNIIPTPNKVEEINYVMNYRKYQQLIKRAREIKKPIRDILFTAVDSYLSIEKESPDIKQHIEFIEGVLK